MSYYESAVLKDNNNQDEDDGFHELKPPEEPEESEEVSLTVEEAESYNLPASTDGFVLTSKSV